MSKDISYMRLWRFGPDLARQREMTAVAGAPLQDAVVLLDAQGALTARPYAIEACDQDVGKRLALRDARLAQAQAAIAGKKPSVASAAAVIKVSPRTLRRTLKSAQASTSSESVS